MRTQLDRRRLSELWQSFMCCTGSMSCMPRVCGIGAKDSLFMRSLHTIAVSACAHRLALTPVNGVAQTKDMARRGTGALLPLEDAPMLERYARLA